MRLFTFILILVFPLFTFAQDDAMVEALETVPEVSVQRGSHKVKKDSHPAYISTIRADKGEVEKEWRKFIEDKYDCDFKKSKGVYEALGIRMPDVTNETVSLYTAIEDASPGAKIKVMVDLGGKYIDGGTEGDKLSRMISGFSTDFYDLYYADVIAKQTKVMDKADKAVEKLEKDGEKLVKSLEGERKSIEKANENITKSEQEIESLTKKIEELRQSIVDSEKKIGELEGEVEKNAEAVVTSKEAAATQRSRVTKLTENHEVVKGRK